MVGRELIAPVGDKRYVRRSIARDVRQCAKSKAKSGQGDRGDRKAR